MTRTLALGVALTALMLSGVTVQAANNAPTATKIPAVTTGAPAKTASDKPNIVPSQQPDQWLASTFRGTDVIGPNNKNIGSVSDILFDQSGRIEAYVMSVGGFLGVGAKDVAIAPSSFTIVPGNKGARVKLKLSDGVKQIKEARNFKPYRPPHETTGSAPAGSLPRGALSGSMPRPVHPPTGQ
jgi:hypothetical protein